jgi:hypothetical protein
MAASSAPPPVSANLSDGQAALSTREAAEYIAFMLEGLRLVALQAELPFLAYLLSVALEEAHSEKTEQD